MTGIWQATLRDLIEVRGEADVKAELSDFSCPLNPDVEYFISSNKILAADTAYRVFELLGRDDFRAMLRVIQKAWNGDGESFQMGMLKGFGYIYQHCGSQVRRLSTDDFAKPFAGFPISKIVERSRTLTGTMDRRFALALLEQYNKKKRSGKIILSEA